RGVVKAVHHQEVDPNVAPVLRGWKRAAGLPGCLFGAVEYPLEIRGKKRGGHNPSVTEANERLKANSIELGTRKGLACSRLLPKEKRGHEINISAIRRFRGPGQRLRTRYAADVRGQSRAARGADRVEPVAGLARRALASGARHLSLPHHDRLRRADPPPV